MARKQTKTISESETNKANHLFTKAPVGKAVLKMALPSMVLMLVLGSYFFFDSVLSINLTSDHYAPIKNPANGQILLPGTDMVRYAMNGYSPINSLMIAFSLLIGMGVSTRVSINLGAKRKKRALNTIKTGTMIGLSLAIVLTPILIVVSKTWIGSQYDQLPQFMKEQVVNNAFKYAWPVILSFPLTMFNQTISGLLRVEARNKQMMIALITPIFVNLLMDYLLMGPGGMGVEGGAWATFTATATTTLLLSFFVYRTKNSVIRFGNLLGFKFKILSIIGIILVGVSPFMRNIGQSITQTTQMQVYQQISTVIYGQPNTLVSISTGIMPVFAFFFPVMFAFAQAARPIASFNFGAKNYKRVKQVYWWTLLYATLAAIIIYFIVAWGMASPLFDLLQVQGFAKQEAMNAIKIIMLAMIGFGGAIAAMVIFGSTDRIILSILAAMMQGLILLWPIMYGLKSVAIDNPDYKYWIWWMWPIINLVTSSVLTLIAGFTMHRLGAHYEITIDEKISIIDGLISSKDFRAARRELINEFKEETKKIKATTDSRKELDEAKNKYKINLVAQVTSKPKRIRNKS